MDYYKDKYTILMRAALGLLASDFGDDHDRRYLAKPHDEAQCGFCKLRKAVGQVVERNHELDQAETASHSPDLPRV